MAPETIKKPKKTLKIIIIAVSIIIIVGIICFSVYLISVKKYQDEVSAITFFNIDITQIENGTYTGEYDVGFIYAKVDVIIEDGEIIVINLLEHKNERGTAAEKILDKIIENQSVEVDAIAQATNSSRVIKKAVEEALMSGVLKKTLSAPPEG